MQAVQLFVRCERPPPQQELGEVRHLDLVQSLVAVRVDLLEGLDERVSAPVLLPNVHDAVVPQCPGKRLGLEEV